MCFAHIWWFKSFSEAMLSSICEGTLDNNYHESLVADHTAYHCSSVLILRASVTL